MTRCSRHTQSGATSEYWRERATSLCDEHIREYIRAVRLDGVHTPGEEAPHVIRIIDGPHMDRNVPTVRFFDQLWGQNAIPLPPVGDLEDVDPGRKSGTPRHPMEKPEQEAVGPTCAPWPLVSASIDSIPLVLSRDQHAVLRLMLADEPYKWAGHLSLFGLDVEPDIGTCLEQFMKRRDGDPLTTKGWSTVNVLEPVPCIEFL